MLESTNNSNEKKMMQCWIQETGFHAFIPYSFSSYRFYFQEPCDEFMTDLPRNLFLYISDHLCTELWFKVLLSFLKCFKIFNPYLNLCNLTIQYVLSAETAHIIMYADIFAL